jgi:hypothetical protein
MSTIAFSTPWTLKAVPWIFRFGNYGSQSAANAGLLINDGIYPGIQYSNARIDIMQGTAPSTLVGLEALAARSSDLLMSFTCPSQSPSGSTIQYFMAPGLGQPGNGEGTNPQLINSIYKNATASGTATWFRWLVMGLPSYNVDPTSVIHQIIGTITDNAGSGDLKMDSTTIVAGQPYRISSIQFYTPTSFVY